MLPFTDRMKIDILIPQELIILKLNHILKGLRQDLLPSLLYRQQIHCQAIPILLRQKGRVLKKRLVRHLQGT
jgi:hypothetical protein